MTVTAADAKRVLARRVLEQRRVIQDPARLMSWMTAPDTRDTATAPRFTFEHMRDDESAASSGWGWQRAYFNFLYFTKKTISLKARQLGMSWISCGTLVTDAVLLPGSLCLVFRQKERDAWDNVERCWQLYESLPQHLRFGSVIEKPSRVPHPIPTAEFRIRFPDGTASTIRGMSSGSSEGHGSVVRRALMDEFAHMENAADVMTGVGPAVGQRGFLMLVSTAQGVSDEETGDGNNFHWIWTGANHGAGVQEDPEQKGRWTQEAAGDNGFTPIFFGWDTHPERDLNWYETDPEIRQHPPHKRAEQYPSNPQDAFRLSNRVFFDVEALEWYGRYRRAKPVRCGDFKVADVDRAARFVESARGMVTVFRPPDPASTYAIGADVATGGGLDYSAAYVVDLSTMELCAEFHGKLGEDLYAEQLHYLGKWYGTSGGCQRDALLAVETGGGHGTATIIALRDGTKGRPAYRHLYRHILSSRPDMPEAKPYGFPMNKQTRPLAVNGLEQVIRERLLPPVPGGLLGEMGTFVRYPDKTPSPAAQIGCRDDRVMAACIALEMYRLRGTHPLKRAHKKSARRPSPQPWLEWAA